MIMLWRGYSTGERRLLRYWLVATAVALGLGFFLAAVLTGPSLFPFSRTGWMTGTFIGLTTGIAQWLILKRYFPVAWWWIIANAAGATFGYLAGWFLGFLAVFGLTTAFVSAVPDTAAKQGEGIINLPFWSYLAGGAIAGATVGIAVGGLIRLGHSEWGRGWIVVMGVAGVTAGVAFWIVGYAGMWIMDRSDLSHPVFTVAWQLLAGIVAGIPAGLIVGTRLIGMLRRLQLRA